MVCLMVFTVGINGISLYRVNLNLIWNYYSVYDTLVNYKFCDTCSAPSIIDIFKISEPPLPITLP